MYKILVTGSEGQLGSHLKIISKEFNDYKYFFTDKNELDICNKELVFKFINDNKINIIINCAAYTAVDKAETDFKLANNIDPKSINGKRYLAFQGNQEMLKQNKNKKVNDINAIMNCFSFLNFHNKKES